MTTRSGTYMPVPVIRARRVIPTPSHGDGLRPVRGPSSKFAPASIASARSSSASSPPPRAPRPPPPPCRSASARPSPGGSRSILLKTSSSGVSASPISPSTRRTAAMRRSKSCEASTTCRNRSASPQLLEGGAEGGHQIRREVADEAHGVGHDHLAVAREAQPARGGVERREQLVLDVDLPARQRVEQRCSCRRSCSRRSRASGGRARAPRAAARTLAREGVELRSSRAMRSRTRRRSISSLVSPGPRPPMPPARRESEVSRCARRGSRYLSCASSTWSLPSRVEARCAKMSRISWVRSMTRRSSRSARLPRLAGRRGRRRRSRGRRPRWKQRITSSWSLPAPITVRGSTWGRCWVSTATTETPAERASSRSSSSEYSNSSARRPPVTDHQDRALAGADLVHRRRARELLLEGADPVLEVELELRGQAAPGAAGCRCRRGSPAAAPRRVARPGRPCSSAATLTIASRRSLREVGEVVLGEALVREVGVDAAQRRAGGRGRRACVPSPAARSSGGRRPSRG